MDDQKEDVVEKARHTNAQTDTEAGGENLSPEDNHAKDIKALKAMYDRGHITEEQYNSRVNALKAAGQ